MEIDATRGSVWKTMRRFALPYLCSYFLQTLYGMADLFIIGQFEGAASITAVSIGSQVMHMVTVMLVGLAMGTTVTIAQAVGGGKREQAAWATGNTVTLFLGCSLVLAALLTFLAQPVAALMHTPAEAIPGTVDYLVICFLGIPFITAYNIISAIFRGLGNSRSPMIFIAIACAANILLDVLFMGTLQMGPAGAALGTTLSQAISVVISLVMIRRYHLGITFRKEYLKPRGDMIRKLLRIGVPIALQDGFIQVAFLTITVIANERGITVTGIRDYGDEGVVEYVVSELVRCLHGFGQESWEELPREITGLKVGIVGLGKSGGMIADALKFFGADISYYARSEKEAATAKGYRFLSLGKLL